MTKPKPEEDRIERDIDALVEAITQLLSEPETA